MNHATFFVAQPQYNSLAGHLPEPPPSKTKPLTPNDELLNGILFVLKTGCRWQDIPTSICSHGYSSCWRSRGALKLVWQQVLVLLDHEGQIDLSLGNLDGTLVQSPKFQGTGFSKKHKRTGTNISLVTEKQGLPLANIVAKGNRHDIVSAEATVKKIRIGDGQCLTKLNAAKCYDSAAFRRKLGNKATGKFRAFIERTNAWLKYFRKLRYRWERKKRMFQACVDLACLLICLRRVEI